MGERTLVYFYYSGYAKQDMPGNLHAVLNGPRTYPLEQMIVTLAKQEDSYVIVLFDCVRE